MRRHGQPLIDVYFTPTPDGRRITIMLEECGAAYRVVPQDPPRGAGFDPEVEQSSPDDRMPVIVDHETGLHVFGSGAALQYLAEKTGRFLPIDPDGKYAVLQWLFWQIGGLGPMAAQLAHFLNDAPGGRAAHAYAQRRYHSEYGRLLAVMDRRLSHADFLGQDYSIADMAAFPWVAPYRHFGQDLAAFPGVRRWFDVLKHRPGVRRGMDVEAGPPA